MEDKYRLKELGNFLKARRERISPTQVGLPYGNNRRTSGLKREEVAQLANVSLSWYTWLEQGRSIKVSSQVLESIGHALLLNEAEMRYIFILSQLAMTDIKLGESQIVIKPLQVILNKLEPFPSFAFDQYWNVIGWNASAKMVFGDYEKMNDRERNIIWRTFMVPYHKTLFSEWDKVTQWLVANFRLSCGIYASDQWFIKFIKELMDESEDFKKCWLKCDVFEEDFKKRIMLESVGELVFDFICFEMLGTRQIKIGSYTPANDETFEKINTLSKKLLL
jgi:transcriptional regulator with XRE-family HTH domain